MKMLLKFVSFLLTFIMIFSVFTVVPFTAAAAEAAAWTDLQSRIDASSAVYVTLTRDITAGESDSCITVESGKSVTLDLSGHTLSRGLTEEADNGSVITIKSGGTLTLRDSAGDNSGTLSGGYNKNGGGIVNEGTLILEGGRITANVASEKGGAVYNKGTVTCLGGRIVNNSAKDGGGIYNDAAGTVTLSGNAAVTANKTSENSGGGIANYGALTVSDDAEISGNYGYTNGGGVFNNGTMSMSGGKITGNGAIKAGSGICDLGTLKMYGEPVVKDNIGDDVFLAADKTITVNGAFRQNTKIGVTSATERAVVTNGYGNHNSASPSDYFFENGSDCAGVTLNGGEIRLGTQGIPYIERDWDSDKETVTKVIKHLTNYITLSDSVTQLNSDSWYVVKNSVTISERINNYGRANLVLCDGASVEFSKGICNQADMNSELNIYAQQEGSGKLVAAGSESTAALGAQNKSKNGTINIYGGMIELKKGGYLYYLGSANGCAGGIIRVYGSEIRCAVIGCGSSSSADASAFIGLFNSKIHAAGIHNGAGVLDICNSTVNCTGQIYSPAAIGGYEGCSQMGDINIRNSYIDAKSQSCGAVIGSNKNCSAGNISIINSTVIAESTTDSVYGGGTGAAIGSGEGGNGGNILIDHSCVAAYGKIGAGIGGGKGKSGGTVNITDSVVLASSAQGGAGIGGGDGGDGGDIRITRSYVYAKTVSSQQMGGASKNFQKFMYSLAFEIMSKMVNGESGSGSQIAYYHAGYIYAYFMTKIFAPTHSGAGIGGGDNRNSGTVVIEDSEVVAVGGKYAAGIGGGDEGKCDDITIKNSTVTATGGDFAAGIGSGDEASGNGHITIQGSNVKATGGTEGAGIGGGNQVSGGTIEIKDSTVTATGGDYAAGIGGGDDGNGGTIDLFDSDITATGGKDGAGIGGGEDGNGGNVKIGGSAVRAKGKRNGAGIGGGESGSSASISIYNGSTVEAESGGDGNAAAIGYGDYYFSSASVTLDFESYLIVLAGSKSSSTKKYTGDSRYDAVVNHKYAKIYTCDHQSNFEWVYGNRANHQKRCNECGGMLNITEEHTWNSENICTVCGCSAEMVTMKFIEKDANEREITTEIYAPRYTPLTAPECTKTPDGMEFVCWRDRNIPADGYGTPNVCDAGDQLPAKAEVWEAVYLPLVETEYIDSRGTVSTVTARKLSSDVLYLPSGRYVADSSFTFEGQVKICGTVHLILSDGVTVDLNEGANFPLVTKETDSYFYLYGQRQQSGVLREAYTRRITLANLTMYGGNLVTDGPLTVAVSTNIKRGTLNVSSLSALDRCEISGGNVTAATCVSKIDNVIGWTELTDSIRFDSIILVSNGSFTVAEGQMLTDGSDIYSGTLTAEQVESISDKTLTPYISHRYSEPDWIWSDRYTKATAVFTCTDDGCDDRQEIDAAVTVTDEGNIKTSEAVCRFCGRDYTAAHQTRLFFDINITDSAHGTVRADKAAARQDDLVRLEIAPDDGYELKSMTVLRTDTGEEVPLEGSGDAFSMPECDVTVTARFAKRIVVTVEFGEGHDDYAEMVFGNTEGFTVSGTTLSYPAYSDETVGDVQGAFTEKVNFGMSGAILKNPVDNGEYFMRDIALHPIEYYATYNDRRSEMINEYSAELPTDGITFYALWAKPVGDVSLTVTPPEAGTVIGKAGSGALERSDPQAEVTVTAEHASLDTDSARNWLDSTFRSLYTGTVEDGRNYYAGFTLEAEYGYYFSRPAENGFVLADGVSVEVTNDSRARFSSNSYDTLSIEATVQAVSHPRFTMHSISLGGDIGVNFYANIPVADRDRNDIKVVFSWKGNSDDVKTVTVPLDKTDTKNGYYKFTCNVCAAEMNDEIEAELCYGDDKVAADAYSVKQYADVILNDSDWIASYESQHDDYEQLATLVKTMLNYGAAAQKQFDHNTDDPVNARLDHPLNPLSEEEISAIAGMIPDKSVDLSEYGLQYYGYSLLLKTKTTLRFYFKIVDRELYDPSKIRFGEGNEAQVYNASFVYIEMSGIAAKNLCDTYALTVGEKQLGEFSALSYVKDVLMDDATDENTKMTVTALYRYNEAASGFFK